MSQTSSLTRRRYQGEADYWRIRDFLRRVYQLNERREWSWQAYRFDYWRWHGKENIGHGRLERDVFLWETAGGDLAAVLNREGPGQAYLQVHPAYRSLALEEEMVAVAERHLATAGVDGRRRLVVWADAGDELRHDILRRREYSRGNEAEYQRRRPLADAIPEVPLAAGYTVRALGDAGEHAGRSWVSWRAFHPDEPAERYEGWRWYANVQRAPFYRRDLDLVAVAPAGGFAAFCTIWFDDVTRSGAFEPVGTDPAHQRRGLGKAVMSEGLRRLRRLGATLATVGSYSPAAHALYASVGFTQYDLSQPWTKTL